MNASDNCIRLIKRAEGFEAAPYLCPAGIPTIGYGNTRWEDGTRVKMSDAPIDEKRAISLMRFALKEYEAVVTRYVSVPLTQNQFDALVDFAYNAGAQNLRNSTLLKVLNQGDYTNAAKEFDKWVYGGGKKLPGLVARRAAEKELFLS